MSGKNLNSKDPLVLYNEIAYKSPAGGGLSEPTRVIWNSLLNFQSQELGASGHGMEIGVWYGFGAGFILHHLAEDEHLLLIDKYMNWEQFGSTLEFFVPGANARAVLMRRDSKSIFSNDIDSKFLGGCRFLHVDGEHSYEAVLKDLELAEALLSDSGMIVVDDVLNALCPQVTQALFEYCNASETLELLMFAFNKAYLVRKKALDPYRQWFMRAFSETETPLIDVTVSYGSKDGNPGYWSILPRGNGKRFIFVDKSFDSLGDIPSGKCRG